MKKAFTLIEMVIVIILLGILAAIVVPNQSQYIDNANQASYAATVRTMENKVALIAAEIAQNGTYTFESDTTKTLPQTASPLACDTVLIELIGDASKVVASTTATPTKTKWGVNPANAVSCTFNSPTGSTDTGSVGWTYNQSSNDLN